MQSPFDKIIGQTVIAMLQTPWNETNTGGLYVRSCLPAIVLANGLLVNLFSEHTPVSVEPDDSPMARNLVPAQLLDGPTVVGRTIIDLLRSPQWGSIGVLVDGGLVAHLDIVGDVVGLVVDQYDGDGTSIVR